MYHLDAPDILLAATTGKSGSALVTCRRVFYMKTMLRKLQQAILCISLAATAAGCAKPVIQDIKTQAEADPKVRFSAMKTYAWAGGAGLVNDPQKLWTPPEFDIAAELKHLIDIEMRKRGWAEASNPDMLIAFLVVNDVQELKLIESERAGEVPDLVGVGEGALLIELMDAGTKHTIWLAAATAETQTGRSNELIQERLRFAVEKLFADLPK